MGFLSDLFGLKTQYIDEETEEAELAAEEEKRKAFFLTPDEAKTLGNIDFMRTPKAVKRTFAKSEDEKIVATSAFGQEITIANGQTPTAKPQAISEVKAPTQNEENRKASNERRSADSSMDMFRQMASEIKKY
ncbi:MAG TPA: hypothetical protein DEG17_17510 [Cyanobacteria bacterium UBA11149]|nr:hypothetical protein [Cyanobacteria bacterium UBA11367]HBE59950.1 hypothetical protein [Cyanobacteria bacterium UBA11366]HBK63718.1 hypothetical protein [Cyanobacteria bacterium UBA11166]HBR77118.1 hypothetical protein [Cyanobacteria bacterium UBA11159]HBS67719.1 hypothetical protein [Cyanobacteria bacterium UBA11153]HBW90620.1 hypothetical protein [Cyanobacteria bacterium UBA11149]HCA93670.1 hypothetical protein [Cyanobacteria bacterium UBA9226]